MNPEAGPRERRGGDRRRSGGRRAEDTGAPAPDLPERRDDERGDSPISPPTGLTDDSQAASPLSEGPFARIARTYVAARAVLGGLLCLMQFSFGAAVAGPWLPWTLLLVTAYAVQGAVLWWSLRSRTEPLTDKPRASSRRLWAATIGVDLLVFSLLHLLGSPSTLNFAALLVLPVLMAGVLMPRRWALFSAASASLALLAVSWPSSFSAADGAAFMAQTGLVGVGLFAISLVAGELALRLRREEQSARRSLEFARSQERLNRLVIEEMADGVLVVDERLRVRAANPAARRLLVSQGEAPAAPFSLRARQAWAPLAEVVEEALVRRDWPDAGRDVRLDFGEGAARTLRTRARFTPPAEAAPSGSQGSFCVLLLEDVRTAQARLRQERLAAMGRVSTGIAHEIRNPLAAISQANALLGESGLEEAQARLSRMVADNVRRLQRVVDDVLEAAVPSGSHAGAVDAREEVRSAVTDWLAATGHGPGDPRLRLDLPEAPLTVQFDGDHLRRVLVNLLDNASRHATSEPGSMALRLSVRDERTVVLSLANDGPPMPADVERHLFEPFFSTRSRGSGLGLYICRELCDRYGATIEFRLRPSGERLRNGFLVVIRRSPAKPETPAPPAT